MNRKYITAPANELYGQRLNRTMNAAGISANRLNTHSWISKSMINKLRRGEHSPTLDMILSLNAALLELGAEPVQISVAELPKAMIDPDAMKDKAPAAPAKKRAAPKGKNRNANGKYECFECGKEHDTVKAVRACFESHKETKRAEKLEAMKNRPESKTCQSGHTLEDARIDCGNCASKFGMGPLQEAHTAMQSVNEPEPAPVAAGGSMMDKIMANLNSGA